MKTSTDATHAVEFLRWMFGDQPDGYIYILRSRPSSDPVEARQGKPDLNPATFSTPEKVDSHWWNEQGHHWTMMFSTATVKTPVNRQAEKPKSKNNAIPNTVSIPALWCDIDGCKKAGIPADEFYSDIRNSEEASAWVQSSERGLQAYFKLPEPYEANGDKDRFAEDLAGLLYDMALYYGGDCKVVRLGGLMRLPGSLNIKPEYKGSYVMARTLTTNDTTFTLRELKERFQPDPDIVPRVVGYACIRALSNIWQEGERHEIMLRFIGSVRRHGINKEACKRVCREVQNYFRDEDRTGDIDSTYDKPFNEIMTLHTDYRSVAEDVAKAIEFWVELKKEYCKKRGFDFFPENVDPTQPVISDDDFFEKGNETWFHGPDTDKQFCNFVIRLKGRVIKADTKASAWVADVYTLGEPATRIEISTADHSQWQRFLLKPGMPVGLSVQEPKLWAHYIAFLQRNCPNMVIKETLYYGWLDTEEDRPTLVLPHVEHDSYIWSPNREDTAVSPTVFTQEISYDQVREYLRDFIKYYANYHEPKYIWPALGWFAACSVKGLIHPQLNGFPVLVVNGLHNSGKSYLIEDVLAVHYGCQNIVSFQGSTSFAFRTKLEANNICPLIIGEFRTEARNDKDRGKVNDLLDLIRVSYDKYTVARGQSSSKQLTSADLQTPWCLVGEHQFQDTATIERSIILTFDRKRVNEIEKMPLEEQRLLIQQHRWLQSHKHRGWLGAILVQWAGKHIEDVQSIADGSKSLVDKGCPSAQNRKRVGVACPATGLIMLSRIYKEYDLDWPLGKNETMNILYEGDASLQVGHDHDTITLRYLFEVTDSVIVEGHRTGRPHEGSLYVYDLDDSKYIYVDMTRWFRLIRPLISSSDAASLTDKNAFANLIQNHQRQEDSPFIEFLNDHAVLGNCVKLDLERVRAFGVNVAQWKGINDYQDI
jgi:hypothetical protein